MNQSQISRARIRAQEINRLYDEICGELRTTVQKAIRVGELLVEQKAECGHGNWLPWLKANVKFSKSSAENFINAYKRRDKFPTVGNLTLKEAYGYLKQVTEPEPLNEVKAEIEPEPEKTERERKWEQELEAFFKLPEEEQEARLMKNEPRSFEENEFKLHVLFKQSRELLFQQGENLRKIRDAVLWEYGGKAWHALCWIYYGPPNGVDLLIEDVEKRSELFESNRILERHNWHIDWMLYTWQSKLYVRIPISRTAELTDLLESSHLQSVASKIQKAYEEWSKTHEE